MRTHPVLDALQMAGVKMGLERMRSFLAFLGNPQDRYPIVHVAGTNGKGSVCRMAGAMLEAQGFKVGVTTSPHLQAVNERLRLGATPIDDAALDGLLWELADARDRWAAATLEPTDGVPLTWFEMSIAAAWLWFAREQVEVAVVEVGMGGRLDATSVCRPTVTGIVTIGLDHVDQLGPDHASIAAEKAGIVRAGVPLVIGPLPEAALRVVRSIAAERGAPTRTYGVDFDVLGPLDAAHFRGAGGPREGLAVGLSGDHQRVNAAVALELVGLLPPALRVEDAAARVGLARAANPGRIERLAPDLVVDGAHNVDGAQVLAAWLAGLPRDRRRILLLGGGADKDLAAIGATLAPQVDQIWTTRGSHPKARSPFEVAAQLEGLAAPVTPAGPLAEALAAARNGRDLVIVAGSLYLVGDVRDLLGVEPA